MGYWDHTDKLKYVASGPLKICGKVNHSDKGEQT